MREKTQQYQQKLSSWPTFALACEVNYLAERLGVQHEAINGALAHLHQAKRVIGYLVKAAEGRSDTYAIALFNEP